MIVLLFTSLLLPLPSTSLPTHPTFPPPPPPPQLQGYIRGWLIRRRWKKVVRQYLDSPSAATVKKRNQVRFVKMVMVTNLVGR